ncbi:MAG: hypothetical protein ETSY1_39615 [Candidatus Entotheonella factor]|uniref:NrtR DNA-binding winged helix domain-containing protein n=1 Tax=Entotheonella factor TaxID=1429438 RepID=W4L5J4_ENTF1|nr:MAG: hypothetical protein ETSY1_39615 [Candidatus Entotheonella factor]
MPPLTHPQSSTSITIGLNAVIVAVTAEVPRILTVKRTAQHFAALDALESSAPAGDEADALPFGPLEPERHHTLERGLRSWVEQQTGLQLGYVEQLYTFGDRFRTAHMEAGAPWIISVAYLALVREGDIVKTRDVQWRDWYGAFPWEDWRSGRPALIEESIQPALEAWSEAAPEPRTRQMRQERVEITFGLHGAPWDPDRVLERYELLYEAGLVDEPHQGLSTLPPGSSWPHFGRPMALDHRRILATALGRLRGKIKYRPVVFELLPPSFTLWQLQRVVESLAGKPLHKQNFRRLLERGGLVEGTGQYDLSTGGRPAELFRFRRDVLRERAAPGVGLPGVAARG